MLQCTKGSLRYITFTIIIITVSIKFQTISVRAIILYYVVKPGLRELFFSHVFQVENVLASYYIVNITYDDGLTNKNTFVKRFVKRFID